MKKPANDVVHGEESVEFLKNAVWLSTAQDHVRPPLGDLDLLDADLHLPAIGVERGQFVGWRLLGVEDRRHQSIEGLCGGSARIVELVVDDAHRNTGMVLSSLPVRRKGAAQIGPVGEGFLGGKDQVLLDPPEQVRTRLPGFLPQVEAVVLAIAQAEHARRQAPKQRTGQGDLPFLIRPGLRTHHGPGTGFAQRHPPELRIGALFPTAHVGAPEMGLVRRGVGHFHRAPVQAQPSILFEYRRAHLKPKGAHPRCSSSAGTAGTPGEIADTVRSSGLCQVDVLAVWDLDGHPPGGELRPFDEATDRGSVVVATVPWGVVGETPARRQMMEEARATRTLASRRVLRQ